MHGGMRSRRQKESEAVERSRFQREPETFVQRREAHSEPEDSAPRLERAGRLGRNLVQMAVAPEHRFFGGDAPMQLRDAREEAVENRTGMPDRLKGGLEQLSGIDLSGVRVHYNSAKPAQLQALAYTQGRDIHVGPGEERHLPHEGWHVVQQMEGRVRPTMALRGVAINDDRALEHEATEMGTKALQMRSGPSTTQPVSGALAPDTPGWSAVRPVTEPGVQGAGSPLPYLDTIQQSFGRHDISCAQAFIGTKTANRLQRLDPEPASREVARTGPVQLIMSVPDFKDRTASSTLHPRRAITDIDVALRNYVGTRTVANANALVVAIDVYTARSDNEDRKRAAVELRVRASAERTLLHSVGPRGLLVDTLLDQLGAPPHDLLQVIALNVLVQAVGQEHATIIPRLIEVGGGAGLVALQGLGLLIASVRPVGVDLDRLSAMIRIEQNHSLVALRNLYQAGLLTEEINAMLALERDAVVIHGYTQNVDANFTNANLLYGSAVGVNVGSVYFNNGRIRLIHPSGPQVSVHGWVRWSVVEGADYNLFKAGKTNGQRYNWLNQLGRAIPAAVGAAGKLVEHNNNQVTHASRGRPVAVPPFTNLEINIMHHAAINNIGNAGLARWMQTMPVLAGVQMS